MLFIHSLLSSYALTLWLCCLLSCWLCDHFTMIIYIHIASFVWSFSAMMGAEYYFRQNNIYDWVSFGNWTECEDGSIRRKWCWWWRRRGRRIVLRLLFIFLCTYKITLLAAKERERDWIHECGQLWFCDMRSWNYNSPQAILYEYEILFVSLSLTESMKFGRNLSWNVHFVQFLCVFVGCISLAVAGDVARSSPNNNRKKKQCITFSIKLEYAME